MFRDIFEIYNKHLPTILILCVSLVFPITFFIQLSIVYVYESGSFAVPSLISFCLLVINFIILFSPFSFLTIKDLQDDPFRLKELFAAFFNHFLYLLLFTIVVYAVSVLGSFLLLIPTIVGIAILMLAPIFLHEESIKGNLHNVWTTLKAENISVIGDIILIISTQLLLWSLLTYAVKDLDNSFFFFLVLRTLINTFLFPFFYIYLTRRYGLVERKRKLVSL